MFFFFNISSFLFFNFLGLRGFIFVNTISVLLLWGALTSLLSNFLVDGLSVDIILGEFNHVSLTSKVEFKLSFNKTTVSFGYLTLTIGMFTLWYSLFYFRGEPTAERLTFLLMMFVNSMLVLLFSGNLIVLFIGWEMIGVTSFFLINY